MAAAVNHLDLVVDSRNGGVSKHLGHVADFMFEWEGRIAECLELTPADISNIKLKYPNELSLQIRGALEKWKQNLGCQATYQKLIEVFESAGYQGYADFVRNINFDERLHAAGPVPVPLSTKLVPCEVQNHNNIIPSHWDTIHWKKCIFIIAVSATVILAMAILLALYKGYAHNATAVFCAPQTSSVDIDTDSLLTRFDRIINSKKSNSDNFECQSPSKEPSHTSSNRGIIQWLTVITASCATIVLVVAVTMAYFHYYSQKRVTVIHTAALQTPGSSTLATNNYSLLTKQEEEIISNPKSKGRQVVDLCIRKLKSKTFAMLDDNDMLRRIAYVMSDFGNDIQNNGGIWQVPYHGFKDTMDIAIHVRLPNKYANITKAFGIDWTSVTYKDLEKPFYSALAARLFLSNSPNLIPPAHQVEKQARQWKMYYLSGEGDVQMFVDKVNELEGTQA